MCGIYTIIDQTKTITEDQLEKIIDTLTHRGPDTKGIHIEKSDTAFIGLGHRRLSIIDLSENAKQPMSDCSHNYHMVYNGEIYNYKNIQKELSVLGHQFKTNSDSEVLLNAFKEWGPDCVHKLIGMFAIVILDKQKKILTVIRDRAGVKPLFYAISPHQIIIASELKAIVKTPGFKKELNTDAVSLFLKHGYVPTPYSIYQNTYKLPAGHIMQINIDTLHVNQSSYWDIIDYANRPKLDISDNDAINEIENLLIDACQYRMISDVPVGIFLSSGYDSTAVTAVLQAQQSSKLKTFTIGFETNSGVTNEAPQAKRIAAHIGTDHTEEICTASQALAIIPSLPTLYDEPFGDSSAIPTILVSQIAKKHVSVSLSADGGDEIFAGYGKYTNKLGLYKAIFYARHILNPAFSGLQKAYTPSSLRAQSRLALLYTITQCTSLQAIGRLRIETEFFNRSEQRAMLQFPISKYSTTHFDHFKNLNSELSIIDQMLAIDFKTYLVDDILQKVDRASMSVSLESREPLLDHRLIEFVTQLPTHLKVRRGVQKYCLKKIVHRYVPESLIAPKKTGFSAPIHNWLATDLKPSTDHYFSESFVKKHALLNHETLRHRLQEFYNTPTPDRATPIWHLLMLNMWLEKWM